VYGPKNTGSFKINFLSTIKIYNYHMHVTSLNSKKVASIS